MVVDTFKPRYQEVRQEDKKIIDQTELYNEFQAILDYIARPCLKTAKD